MTDRNDKNDKNDKSDKKNQPVPALEVGSAKITWGVILAGTLLIVVVLAALKAVAIYLIERLLGVAVSAWEALLLVLRWGGFVLLAVLLLLVLSGIAELLGRAWRNRRRQEISLQASPLPRNDAIRGGPPRSEMERVMAGVVRHHVMEVRGLDPSQLSDIELARVRMELPELFCRPEYTVQLNAAVAQPVYELLISDCRELERQIELYGQTRQRRPFWQLRRALHIVSRGALGLSAEQVWQGPWVVLLKLDFSEFLNWFWRHGWPLLGILETLLRARGLETQLDALGMSGTTSPEIAAPDPAPTRNPEAAREIISSAEAAIDSPEPWPDPVGRIDALEDAAEEALRQDPQSPDAQRLLGKVRDMRARVSGFEDWFREAIALDESVWPPLLDEAYVDAAGDLSRETLRGHAARLFLTRPTGPGLLEREAEAASAPVANSERPAPVSAEAGCRYPASRPETDDRRRLTLIETLEPSAAERAENLF